MKRVFQTKFGEEGNCFAACVASLFEVEIDEIPFFSDYDDDWDAYCLALNVILKEKFQVILHYGDYKNWKEFLEMNFLDSFYIVGGDSNRGLEHAVIYQNGIEVHNPNSIGTELVNVKYVFFFLKLHF